MRRVFRIAIPVLVVICLIGGGVFLVQQKKKELSQVSQHGGRPRPVTVAQAEKGNLRVEKEYLAVVEPFEEAQISARVTAEIRRIAVDEGDRVEAGSVLAELDAEEIEHRIESAEANIEQARADLSANRATVRALESSRDYWQAEKERDRALADKDSLPRAEAEKTAEQAARIRGELAAARQKSRAIRKKIEALRQQKAELSARRGYYTLTSPFAGRISERRADAGDLAAPGKTLLVLQDQSRLKIAFDIPQKDLPEVSQGMAASFSVSGQSRKAPISVMHPALDKAKMMRAEVWLDRQASVGLSPGAYLPVSVSLKQLDDAILIPESALIEGPKGKRHVFAVTGDRLAAQPVRVLGRAQDRVAVEGIDAGTLVVENTYLGWATLSSGEKVEAVQ